MVESSAKNYTHQGIFIKCDFYQDLNKQLSTFKTKLSPEFLFKSQMNYETYVMPFNPTKEQIINSVREGYQKYNSKQLKLMLVHFCGKAVKKKIGNKDLFYIVVRKNKKNSDEEVVDLEELVKKEIKPVQPIIYVFIYDIYVDKMTFKNDYQVKYFQNGNVYTMNCLYKDFKIKYSLIQYTHQYSLLMADFTSHLLRLQKYDQLIFPSTKDLILSQQQDQKEIYEKIFRFLMKKYQCKEELKEKQQIQTLQDSKVKNTPLSKDLQKPQQINTNQKPQVNQKNDNLIINEEEFQDVPNQFCSLESSTYLFDKQFQSNHWKSLQQYGQLIVAYTNFGIKIIDSSKFNKVVFEQEFQDSNLQDYTYLSATNILVMLLQEAKTNSQLVVQNITDNDILDLKIDNFEEVISIGQVKNAYLAVSYKYITRIYKIGKNQLKRILNINHEVLTIGWGIICSFGNYILLSEQLPYYSNQETVQIQLVTIEESKVTGNLEEGKTSIIKLKDHQINEIADGFYIQNQNEQIKQNKFLCNEIQAYAKDNMLAMLKLNASYPSILEARLIKDSKIELYKNYYAIKFQQHVLIDQSLKGIQNDSIFLIANSEKENKSYLLKFKVDMDYVKRLIDQQMLENF
ncbi:UNKNOWN [Stylonychia lemnae]|uniref:Uncharacterized protein n=1 Tax=Stylonychia lemnae TaxID=5949 RepID=A0A078BA52_STYLE|nr:UNKNOWN [Stylonychia lemnae]|eukprot:CDW91126.1 UNKNOWN [Stylonychia lemnae]